MQHFLARVYSGEEIRKAQLAARAGGPPMPASHEETRKRHTAYLDSLVKEGAVIIAGPFPDGRGGVIVMAAENEEAARTLLEADPFIEQGIFERYELEEFVRHQ